MLELNIYIQALKKVENSMLIKSDLEIYLNTLNIHLNIVFFN